MRVLLIHNRYQHAGGEDTSLQLERTLLEAAGHETVLYEQDNTSISSLSPVRMLALPFQTTWSPHSKRDIETILKRDKPQVAHIHNTFPLISPSVYYACQQNDVPVVQMLHNYRLVCPSATFFRDNHVCEDCLGKTPPLPGVIHACYRGSRAQTTVAAAMLTAHRLLRTWQDQVDIFITPTQFARDRLVAGGLPAEKFVVKPNFIQPDPLPRSGQGDYALFIGRHSPEKGVMTLLEAWGALKDIPLKIVGEGPQTGEIVRAIEANGLANVALLGQLDRGTLISTIKNARFLVMPSEWYETFGLVIVEAFACGVPVVASDLGAMAEIVDDGRTGLLFEPRNAGDLTQKAAWLWSHPAELARMGREARLEFEAKYTAQQNYDQLMEIYRRVIQR